MRIILGLIFLAFLATGAQAKCDPAYAPYYHQIEGVGPGSILMDIFVFPFAVTIGTAAAPVAPRPKRGEYGGAELSHHPLCMAGHVARHAVEQRPVRVEHHRSD